VHSEAASAAQTDWAQIVQLYEQLMAIAPSPVAALNQAVAVAETDGPATALSLVDQLDLTEYRVFHAVRAELLRRLGRKVEAVMAYDEAIRLTENAVEREFLNRQREAVA